MSVFPCRSLPEDPPSHQIHGRLTADGHDLEQLEASGLWAEQIQHVSTVALLDALELVTDLARADTEIGVDGELLYRNGAFQV